MSGQQDEFAKQPSSVAELQRKLTIRWQVFEDKIVPHFAPRWAFLAASVLLFFLRVFFLGGYYVVAYGMSIHILYLFVMLITPREDPDSAARDDQALPTSGRDDDFKPFLPKVMEFKVWRSMMRVVLICFFLTFFGVFDIPVFWPILVLYFIILFVTQMSGRLQHMARHKYVPWTRNKPKYVAKADK